jgi:hypothetical protein
MPKTTIKLYTSQEDSPPETVLTEDGAANILRLLDGVRSSLVSLLSKGYTVRDGRLIPPESGEYVSSSIEVSATKDAPCD